MTAFSDAAYFDDPSRCDYFPRGSEVVRTFQFPLGLWEDAFGYIAVMRTEKRIVLAFRGTDTTSQIIHELLHHSPGPLPHHDDVYVNTYFLTATTLLLPLIAGALEELWSSTCQGCQLWVTGHSLGGAMALLAAQRIADRHEGLGRTPILYTFGQPRVGNFKFAELVAQDVPSFFRVINNADVVPHVPRCETQGPLSAKPCLATRMGYYHAGLEVWFPKQEYRGEVMCGYQECVQGPLHEDVSCSDGLVTPWYLGSITDHHGYFVALERSYCGNSTVASDTLIV